MKSLLVLLSMSLFILGCDAQSKDQSSYKVLIGEEFNPNFKDILVGERYGKIKNIMAFSKESFGTLKVEVMAEDKNEGVFTEGGIVLNMKEGILVLSGDLTKELKMIVMKEVKLGDYIIASKHIINKKKEFQDGGRGA